MRRLGVALVLVVVVAGLLGAARPPRLYWNHDGQNVTRFECVIDSGTPVSLGLPTPTGTTYSALLSACGTFAKGAHQLVVRACNDGGCAAAPAITVVKL